MQTINNTAEMEPITMTGQLCSFNTTIETTIPTNDNIINQMTGMLLCMSSFMSMKKKTAATIKVEKTTIGITK